MTKAIKNVTELFSFKLYYLKSYIPKGLTVQNITLHALK